MPTNRILLLAGDELGRLRAEEKIGDVTFSLMDNKLDELGHALGGCEPTPFCRGIRWRKSWRTRSVPQPTICR